MTDIHSNSRGDSEYVGWFIYLRICQAASAFCMVSAVPGCVKIGLALASDSAIIAAQSQIRALFLHHFMRIGANMLCYACSLSGLFTDKEIAFVEVMVSSPGRIAILAQGFCKSSHYRPYQVELPAESRDAIYMESNVAIVNWDQCLKYEHTIVCNAGR